MEQTGHEDEDESAIERVLRAEEEAETAVDQAREEADRIVAEARRRALGIAERTDERIAAINARSAASVDRRIATLRREEERRIHRVGSRTSDQAIVTQGVQRVLAWLLEGEGSRPDRGEGP